MKNKLSFTLIMLLAGAAFVFAESDDSEDSPPSHEDFMAKFDTNGDGKLSKEEKQAAREAMKKQGMQPGGPREEMRQRLLEKYDANGDGELTGDERKEAGKAMREKMDLKKFDKDGDGTLSDEEKAEAKAFHKQRREEMIEKFDTDGDGKLSKEEREAARETMREAGERFGPPPSNAKGKGKGPDTPPPPFLDEEMEENE